MVKGRLIFLATLKMEMLGRMDILPDNNQWMDIFKCECMYIKSNVQKKILSLNFHYQIATFCFSYNHTVSNANLTFMRI